MKPRLPAEALDNVEIFAGLSEDVLLELGGEMEQMRLARGDILVHQGDQAAELFIVVSGRFEVTVKGQSAAVAEISAGQPIGEIAFLAGGTRTATVGALRDSIVLKLKRLDFDRLCAASPAIWVTLTATLARRLANMNIKQDAPPDPRPRTIAIIPAGPGAVPRAFIEKLTYLFQAEARTITVTSGKFSQATVSWAQIKSADATRELNDLETDYDFVLYAADLELTDWSRKAIRQADLVLCVGWHKTAGLFTVEQNSLEQLAAELHDPEAIRLVLLHDTVTAITGTARWLKDRDFNMHHHVAMDDTPTYERLFRFINGTARGLIACGGGAFCAAHIGVYKALSEIGARFDIMGGTSGGAAMTAAFALGIAPDEIDQQTHEMFVTNKAMKRFTLPLYSLLDHTHFDQQLIATYDDVMIEDLWIPYFAVCANLSSYDVQYIRYGKLWQAIRASSSIPALFPPFYTTDGQMLVDGALVDNVPIRAMHEFKSGPNAVLNFVVPKIERFDIDYDDLPSRGTLLKHLINPLRRNSLPKAPSVGSVLMRSLMANRQDFLRHLTDDDLMLEPPLPSDMRLLDWHRHSEVMRGAHNWTGCELARLKSENDAVLSALID